MRTDATDVSLSCVAGISVDLFVTTDICVFEPFLLFQFPTSLYHFVSWFLFSSFSFLRCPWPVTTICVRMVYHDSLGLDGS